MPKTYEDIFDVAGGLIALAMVAKVVSSPNTAKIITAGAAGFASSLKAALSA